MQEWLYFAAWRWCIFFAGMGPIYFLAELLVHILFLCAESHFFTLRYAFYYAVSIKVRTTLVTSPHRMRHPPQLSVCGRLMSMQAISPALIVAAV